MSRLGPWRARRGRGARARAQAPGRRRRATGALPSPPTRSPPSACAPDHMQLLPAPRVKGLAGPVRRGRARTSATARRLLHTPAIAHRSFEQGWSPTNTAYSRSRGRARSVGSWRGSRRRDAPRVGGVEGATTHSSSSTAVGWRSMVETHLPLRTRRRHTPSIRETLGSGAGGEASWLAPPHAHAPAIRIAIPAGCSPTLPPPRRMATGSHHNNTQGLQGSIVVGWAWAEGLRHSFTPVLSRRQRLDPADQRGVEGLGRVIMRAARGVEVWGAWSLGVRARGP